MEKLKQLKAGTIMIILNKPNIFKRLWYKLVGGYNAIKEYILLNADTIVRYCSNDCEFYTPIKPYNKAEISKLKELLKGNKDKNVFYDFDDVVAIVDIIRPNTFTNTELTPYLQLTINKYYDLA